MSLVNEEGKVLFKLLWWSVGGDFSMDEDMVRIFGIDEGFLFILCCVFNVVCYG